ncbi:STAS domain-containing protein [Streptomyces pactum]|uniref:Anti-sigma factor antagonist n=1 Tax=Streptomyces pactum TaxID=68249 RepID=A0A1S6JH73_9ACTN|nr:STAS domain-containing protein [Streptomyces pactum]AQS71111.1 hypothetical protein B1H29_33265 [Streptomyces pactum]
MTEGPSVVARVSGVCLTVQFGGDMDWRTAPYFRDRLLGEIARGPRCVVLDLSSVPFCDSAGVSVLLWAWRQVEGAGAVLVLACARPQVARTLTLTGVDSVLRMYGSVAEAQREMAVDG